MLTFAGTVFYSLTLGLYGAQMFSIFCSQINTSFCTISSTLPQFCFYSFVFKSEAQLSRVYSCCIKALRITAIHSIDIAINIYHIYPAKVQDFAGHLQKQ